MACNKRGARGTGQRANCETVDWRTSKVKNCEPVANQARADVCSTATDELEGTGRVAQVLRAEEPSGGKSRWGSIAEGRFPRV